MKLVEDKDPEYKIDRIFRESTFSLSELYRKAGVEENSAGFASYVLSLAFSLSLKAYFDTLIKSGGNKDSANLALLNAFSNMFKDEFLDIISKSIKSLRSIY